MIDLVEHFRGRVEGWRCAFDEIDRMIDLVDGVENVTLQEVRDNMQLPYECDVESLDKARDRVLEEGDVHRIRRKASYGRMHGCEASLEYVRSMPESNLRDWTLKRMEYEFEKETPIEPKFHKGIYGKKYDSWSCGHCGKGVIDEAWYRYCPNCGFAIGGKKYDEEGGVREGETPVVLQEEMVSGEGQEGQRGVPQDDSSDIYEQTSLFEVTT